MKKIIYYISGILLIVLIIIINLSSFQKRKLLKIMNSDYSFIINKPIDYSCLDSTNQHISNSNYILNIISPTCEDCYVNLNKWELIASQNKKLQKKIIFPSMMKPQEKDFCAIFIFGEDIIPEK